MRQPNAGRGSCIPIGDLPFPVNLAFRASVGVKVGYKYKFWRGIRCRRVRKCVVCLTKGRKLVAAKQWSLNSTSSLKNPLHVTVWILPPDTAKILQSRRINSHNGKHITTNYDGINLAAVILRQYLNCILPFRQSIQLRARQSTFQPSNRGVSFTHCSISPPWGPAQRRRRRNRKTSRYALSSPKDQLSMADSVARNPSTRSARPRPSRPTSQTPASSQKPSSSASNRCRRPLQMPSSSSSTASR